MGQVVLVTGGARSGKSRWALEWAGQIDHGQPRVFIATAVPTDKEMERRIATHQQERGPGWQTIETGARLAETIDALPPNATAIADCCTVWLGNIWHERGDSDAVLAGEVAGLHDAVVRWRDASEGRLCLITNEVGYGIVPHDAAVRRWRDWSGRMNQGLAEAADRVVLCICGIPVEIKP
jgi:adenosyl cobinamide kinase/adenosyl cobinamide phosphate guanylyltransferase